jgi:predicted tellurium resistance membrane protein TerC
METYFTSDALVALLTLTAMEVVLGIDNIIFVAILVGKLPREQQDRARQLGIGLALVMRLALLLSISWVMGLKEPLFELLGKGFSGRDLILLGGGLFLIFKATWEIHEKLESGPEELHASGGKGARLGPILAQIIVLDIVFSLDSVITAVGMANEIWVMVVAMVVAVAIMLLASGRISGFVHRHPTLKILALSFLLLIGVMLLVEGMGGHVNKGYIYFAMAFSLLVELLNMRLRKVQRPVSLREPRG